MLRFFPKINDLSPKFHRMWMKLVKNELFIGENKIWVKIIVGISFYGQNLVVGSSYSRWNTLTTIGSHLDSIWVIECIGI